MPNRQDEYEDLIVVDLIQDTVVTDAEAVDAGLPSEGLDPRRSRGVLEGVEPLVDSLLNVLRQSEEGTFSGRLENKAVAFHLHEPRLLADLLVRDGSGFVTSNPNRLLVETVFEGFKGFKILDGHERGDGLPVAFQDDPLSAIRHAVEGVPEVVTNGRGGKFGHRALCISYVSYR
ncbi:MAG: hypothetical protein Q7V01_12325 [Vicinamibacterales bacterium]|nr:hypothetical protein [Vicinamibacterales bacterium]